jgi:hypothetical protein
MDEEKAWKETSMNLTESSRLFVTTAARTSNPSYVQQDFCIT